MIGSQQIHWDYVENIGKIKMIPDWKKIVRGKFSIFVIKKKNKIQLFPGPLAIPKGKTDQFSVAQFKLIPFRKCIQFSLGRALC